MEDICIYQIEIRGQVDENELNDMSPIHISVVHSNPACTTLTALTDQSGLIGLIRHLHGMGFIFLSIIYQPIAGSAILKD